MGTTNEAVVLFDKQAAVDRSCRLLEQRGLTPELATDGTLTVLRIPPGTSRPVLERAGIPVNDRRHCLVCTAAAGPQARRCPACKVSLPFVEPGKGPVAPAAKWAVPAVIGVALLGLVLAAVAILSGALSGSGPSEAERAVVPVATTVEHQQDPPAPAGRLSNGEACIEFLDITADLSLDDDGLAARYGRLAGQTADPVLAEAIAQVARGFANSDPAVPGDRVYSMC